MNKKSLAIIVFSTIAAMANPAMAGLVLLSGDSNVVDPLLGTTSSVPGIDAGNQQFFTNILGSGTSVSILDTSAPFNLAQTDASLNTFYGSLGGVSSTVVSGSVSAASLSGVDLFIAAVPDDAFAASELIALAAFLDGGGTLFLLGDNELFTAENGYINDALTALGSSMQIVNDHFDGGWQVATGAQIAADTFTAGVTTFSYAAPSSLALVSGGTSLFFGTDAQPFIAYENLTQVPEPSTLGLLGVGLLGLGFMRRKRAA